MSAEQQQCMCVGVWAHAYAYRRTICLMPCVSRDSKNNEKLCRDFKANSRSFPVVMADTGMHNQETSTHTLCHTFLSQPVNATSFDDMLEPKKRRATFLKSLCVSLVIDLSVLPKVSRSKHAMRVQCQTPVGDLL